MIATIFDIVASKDLGREKRAAMDKNLRDILNQVNDRFGDYCVARPALTQGDSIELLVDSWQPIVFLAHKLLMKGIEFRVGLGTGKITLKKDIADECDGPAFWNARDALDEVKQMKYMSRVAGFKIDDKSSKNEEMDVINSVLFLTTLLSQTTTQLEHCYYYLWEDKGLSEIAAVTETSTANVSKSLSKTPCYLLDRVMKYLSNLPNNISKTA